MPAQQPTAESVGHTAGPWTYDFADDERAFLILTADNGVVADVRPDAPRGIAGAVVEANARLIAAAPELLSVLKRIGAEQGNYLQHSNTCPPDICVYAHADKVIAKAEGRAP